MWPMLPIEIDLATLEPPAWQVQPMRIRGKTRVFHVPNAGMRTLHAVLKHDLTELRDLMAIRPLWSGNSRSVAWCLKPHEHHRYFYHLDLSDAYRHVDDERMIAALKRYLTGALVCQFAELFGDELEAKLRLVCLATDQGLPIGGPASSLLFELYLGVYLDPLLAEVCRHHDLAYSRYADNLIFSRADRKIGRRTRAALNETLRSIGFAAHPRKTMACDLNRRPQILLGVGLCWSHRRRRIEVFVPRRTRDLIRSLLYLAEQQRLDQSGLDRLHGLMGYFYDACRMFYRYPRGSNLDLTQRYQTFVWKLRAGRPRYPYNHDIYRYAPDPFC